MSPIEPMTTATVSALGLCAGGLIGVMLVASWDQLKRVSRRIRRML